VTSVTAARTGTRLHVTREHFGEDRTPAQALTLAVREAIGDPSAQVGFALRSFIEGDADWAVTVRQNRTRWWAWLPWDIAAVVEIDRSTLDGAKALADVIDAAGLGLLQDELHWREGEPPEASGE